VAEGCRSQEIPELGGWRLCSGLAGLTLITLVTSAPTGGHAAEVGQPAGGSGQ